jgi:hypothetical protein
MQFSRLTFILLLFTPLIAAAQHSAPSSGHPSAGKKAGVYAPYEFLIGEWEVFPQNATAPVAVTRFIWGTGKSYILFSTALVRQGKEEPHFEGMLMWNGVHKNLDMLVALDLNGGRAQEQGTLILEPDGTVVREHFAYLSEGVGREDGSVVGPGGASLKFRQTFKAQGPNTLISKVLRETKNGWVPTFPGSDNLIMKRRAS